MVDTPTKTAAADNPAKDILIIVFSKTPEKVAHFELVAEKSRVKFIDIHRLAEGYNVAPEDTRDRKENAEQKADYVVSTLKKLQHADSVEHKNLLAQCVVLGIAFDPAGIFGMVEDSTFTVSPKVWPYLRKRLKHFVDADLLLKYEGKDDGSEAIPGPGAETGPIVSAVGGFLRFYNLLRSSGREALEKSGVRRAESSMIESQCTVVLTPLNDITRKISLEARVSNRLLAIPPGEDYDHNDKNKSGLINPYAYVAMPNDDTKPIAKKFETYHAKFSPRAKVFKAMQRFLFSYTGRAKPSVKGRYKAAKKEVAGRAPVVREPLICAAANQDQNLREKIYAVINREDLFARSGAKGVTLHPFNPNNYCERLGALYDLTSLMVAKQLIARDMFKPLIILDDGCWKDIIRTLASLANKGMAKDFVPFVQDYSTTDINHITTSFFDCLRYNPQKYNRENNLYIFSSGQLLVAKRHQNRSLRAIVTTIIKERGAAYTEFQGPALQAGIISEGAAPDGRLFTVAHFVSATSDNKTIIQSNERFGEHLAKADIGYVWGGMNMHAGGVAFNAYKKAGGAHAAAYSTIPIAAAETADGRLPANADYREWSRNIYERMAGMIAAADVIVVDSGGWGTLQEMLALLVLKKEAPELFADKKIIVRNSTIHDSSEFSGGYFWDRSIQTIFDVKHRNTDFSSSGDKDVYIVHSDSELHALTDRLHKDYIKKSHYEPAPTGADKPNVAALQALIR